MIITNAHCAKNASTKQNFTAIHRATTACIAAARHVSSVNNAKIVTRLKNEKSKQKDLYSYAVQLIRDKNYSEINRIMDTQLLRLSNPKPVSHEYKCTLCLKTKPASEFHECSEAICGKTSRCKNCQNFTTRALKRVYRSGGDKAAISLAYQETMQAIRGQVHDEQI